MEIQLIEKNDFIMRFVVKSIDVCFMNTLRRIILTEVPSMAIDEIIVFENSSTLHDEILAHRLGLIPLKTDLDSYNLPEECPCNSEFGCNRCRAAFTLEVEAKDSQRTVFSEDLKPDDPGIIPVSDSIPIVKLSPGQKIKLEIYAVLGKGKKHAKWHPVTMCVYKPMPQIKIDIDRCDMCGKCVKGCPKDILVKDKNEIKIQEIMACTLCQDCVDVCPLSPPAIELQWNKNTYIFSIESSGALPTERIILEALNILDNKVNSFVSQLVFEKVS